MTQEIKEKISAREVLLEFGVPSEYVSAVFAEGFKAGQKQEREEFEKELDKVIDDGSWKDLLRFREELKAGSKDEKELLSKIGDNSEVKK